MFIEHFNKAWEKERKKIEIRLSETFEKEIKSLQTSAKYVEDEKDKEYALELKKKRAELILRKSLVVFESEKIAKERMQEAKYLNQSLQCDVEDIVVSLFGGKFVSHSPESFVAHIRSIITLVGNI